MSNLGGNKDFKGFLEGFLYKCGRQHNIDSKEDYKSALSSFNDICVDLYFGKDTFTEAEAVDNRVMGWIKEELSKEESVFISGNNEVLVTPSAKKPGYYQITTFDSKGAISDSQQPNIDKVLDYMFQNNIYPFKKEYAEHIQISDKRCLSKEKKNLDRLKYNEFILNR